MTQERIDLLNELGFVWNLREMAWYQQLNSFKSFREEFGHSNVPVNCTKHRKLCMWVNVQRRQYVLMKRGERSMDPARVKVLDSIGFCWDISVAQCARWLLRFQVLKEFMDMHGHCVIPVNLPKLHLWVKLQRRLYRKYKKGKLSEEQCNISEKRISALDSIGFNWNPSNQNFVRIEKISMNG
jgi:hypothetical protein